MEIKQILKSFKFYMFAYCKEAAILLNNEKTTKRYQPARCLENVTTNQNYKKDRTYNTDGKNEPLEL